MEEIQKQLRDLLKNKDVQVAFAPFMQSMTGDDNADKDTGKGKDVTKPVEAEPTRDEQLDGIRAFDRKPKEIRDYLDRFVIKQEQAKRLINYDFCANFINNRTC